MPLVNGNGTAASRIWQVLMLVLVTILGIQAFVAKKVWDIDNRTVAIENTRWTDKQMAEFLAALPPQRVWDRIARTEKDILRLIDRVDAVEGDP